MFTFSVDFPSKWEQLSDIVFRLIRCKAVSRDDWNASFLDVYALCNSRPVSHAPALYSSTGTLIIDRVKEVTDDLSQLDDIDLLPAYVRNWEVFHQGITHLDNLYRYVNQQYVKSLRPTEAEMCYSAVLPMAERHTMEILEIGLASWKAYLVDVIKDRLSTCLMREVLNDRMGIIGQQNCIAPAIDSFRRISELRDAEKISMDMYNRIFQLPLLETTKTFYSNWAEKHESEHPCLQYITDALALRTEEENRTRRYYPWSVEKIKCLFQEIIVAARLPFLNDSVRDVVAREDKLGLHNLFQLLSPGNLCAELSHCFGQHIMDLIRESIANQPQDINLAPAHFVEGLLSIRNRFVQFIDDIFDGMSLFRNQMDKAFNKAVNERGGATTSSKPFTPRPSELLSRYMDSLLRKYSKLLSESDLESKIASSIDIFKYIEDKDVFQKYYQRMLCKRLISNVQPVMELEELAINQLKAVCGYEFTAKFQRMFNDVQLAPELNAKFTQYLEANNIHLRIDHHFNVLTQCSWPITPVGTAEFRLPDELQLCNTHFEAFYCQAHQGRKMRWAHHYSIAEVAMLFTEKPYQLQVPAICASILLYFDSVDSDVIQLRDLRSNVLPSQAEPQASGSDGGRHMPADPTAIITTTGDTMDTSFGCVNSFDQLDRILAPLLDLRVVLLDPEIRSHADIKQLPLDSRIILNRGFISKRLKLKVNLSSQSKETTQADAEQMDRQVNEDRRYFIQAAIVRIMKTRKQIDHTSLIKSVLQQAGSRFQPSVPLIKRCVESLIEKGYIERSPDDADQYSYLA
ncbi:unnamed protein product [Dicrocoelium dendriticum]|nr:unnamed protein product [Dicrocoelium dendriticum]